MSQWLSCSGFTAGIVVLGLVLVPSEAVQAVDGVIEINQASALAGGFLPGDGPGFPVTIGQAGSYRLTGNLVVASSSAGGIEITAGPVTLDLNGFRVSGPGSGSGTESGIAVSAGNVRIHDGAVASFGGDGITTETDVQAFIERVRAIGNGEAGITVGGPGSVVTNCMARDNGADGIAVGFDGLVSHCTSVDNGEDGIQALSGSSVTGNTASGNGLNGFNIFGASAVIGNVARLNAQWGLNLAADTGYASNVMSGNGDSGLNAVTSGYPIGGNLCDGGPCGVGLVTPKEQ